jgi:hypothetical protein
MDTVVVSMSAVQFMLHLSWRGILFGVAPWRRKIGEGSPGCDFPEESIRAGSSPFGNDECALRCEQGRHG